MFEPVHGSAPKYAGKDTANPVAAILTAQMMLDHPGLADAASSVETAVTEAIQAGECTRDLGGSLGTAATGDGIARRVRERRARAPGA